MDGKPRLERQPDRNRKLRQAFVEGAEERSRRALGRGLTREELERVLRRNPGDQPERWSGPGSSTAQKRELLQFALGFTIPLAFVLWWGEFGPDEPSAAQLAVVVLAFWLVVRVGGKTADWVRRVPDRRDPGDLSER